MKAYSDRLSDYIDEMKQALDFVEGIEEIVKDSKDIKELGEGQETVVEAV